MGLRISKQRRIVIVKQSISNTREKQMFQKMSKFVVACVVVAAGFVASTAMATDHHVQEVRRVRVVQQIVEVPQYEYVVVERVVNDNHGHQQRIVQRQVVVVEKNRAAVQKQRSRSRNIVQREFVVVDNHNHHAQNVRVERVVVQKQRSQRGRLEVNVQRSRSRSRR